MTTPTSKRFKRWFKSFRRAINPGYALARHHLARTSGGRVHRGPFAGMRYVQSSVGSCFEAKLLGTYELELFDAVERVCERELSWVINVGAAEGYYAVGLLRRRPEARVIAYEANPEGRALIEDLARRNGCADRIEVRGFCDPADLKADLEAHPGAFVLMDVEGGEDALLDPAQVPGLVRAPILVEIHEFALPGVGARVQARFTETHRAEVIEQRHRSRADLTIRHPVLDPWLEKLTNEHRPRRGFPMTWAVLEPRAGRAAFLPETS